MTCKVLAPHLYRIVTDNVWELSDFSRQQLLVDAHNNRLNAEIIARENQRQAEITARARQQENERVAQVTQQKAVVAKAEHRGIRIAALSIAGIVIFGVLLVLAAAHMRRRDRT